MSYLSVSTWSLHRLLGPLRWTIWEDGSHRTVEEAQPQVLTLLELPAEAARRGYQAIEICHFHFPSTEPAYLAQLHEAFKAAGIQLDTILLDYGDLTASDEGRREADIRLIRQWIEIASQCGSKQIRVIAGEAMPKDEAAIRQAASALSALAEYGAGLGVAVLTENFKRLTSTGNSCLHMLKETTRAVGFITDFGNFQGRYKYDELGMIVPFSVSVHAKAHYDEAGLPDAAEFQRCLETVHDKGFDGAYVLIYDGPGDMWEGLERIKQLVQPWIRSDA